MAKVSNKNLLIEWIEENDYIIDYPAILGSTNSAYDNVYWADIPDKRMNANFYLLLNDKIKCEVHLFFIPKGSINPDLFSKKSGKSSIQIKYNDCDFTDIRSGSKRVKFSKYKLATIDYPEDLLD